MNKLRTLPLGTLLFAGLLPGCKLGPDYEKPADNVPAAWSAAEDGYAKPADDRALQEWWRGMGDPKLAALVERALARNLDLASASAALISSREQVDITRAALIPNLGASGGYTRSHDPSNTHSLSTTAGSWSSGADASWELDLFGKNRRSLEASEASAEAALDDLRGIRVSIAAEVARNYAQWLTLAKQTRFARENLAASESLLKIVKIRHDAGSVGDVDLVNAEADVLSTRSGLITYEVSEAGVIAALALLLATDPASMRAELGGNAPDIAVTLPVVPSGVPSDLIRRRPDIRAAERRLQAANAGIGAAVADYFPKFSLTGNLGISGSVVSANAPAPGLAWSAGPSISWNPFQGGAVSANIEVQKALTSQSTFAYRKTVINALGEVETALLSCRREGDRREINRRLLAAQQRSVELTTTRYDNGQADIFDLLTARRQLYAAQTSLADSDNSAFTNLVSLYKALGGGWSERSEREAAATAAGHG